MQISYININEIKQAQRFDAEYFKPEFLKIENKLKKIKWKYCKDIVERKITKGETPLWQGFNYLKDGVPFIRSQNIKNLGILKEDLVFISYNYNKIKQRSIIKKGDILLAIVGATIGEIGFYDLEVEGNCNQAVAIISAKKDIFKYYLFILFKTFYIQKQISRMQGGNARDNVDLNEVQLIRAC